ncbi:hypothetical protein HPP92_013213 [Vanilla planifolia]|uniref:Uncharacterized protein n=1 Tax=Vanilla planifolia TaxID=51239 RepID=A0A835QX79_VANPL|nr:hypothetical protein HPP92_013213 [Vanilla planifolia]
MLIRTPQVGLWASSLTSKSQSPVIAISRQFKRERERDGGLSSLRGDIAATNEAEDLPRPCRLPRRRPPQPPPVPQCPGPGRRRSPPPPRPTRSRPSPRTPSTLFSPHLPIKQPSHLHLQAEMVIKERNMLDVLAMVETYCHLLTDRAFLLHNQKECPEELKEAAAGLAFVASRCRDMPELREVRRIFSSRFGKEFSTAATELRNNCGVSSKIVQKFSTRQPSLESRIQVTKEIAKEKGIKVEIIEPSPESTEHQKTQHSPDTPPPPPNDACDFHQLLGRKAREMNHKDVGSAAQAAYESAAYAAVAARTAVELYRSESRNRTKGVDDSQSVIKLLKASESNSPSNSSCSSRSKAGSFGAEMEKRRGKGIRSEEGEIEIEEMKEEDGSSKAIVELKKSWSFAGFTDLNDVASRIQALERERTQWRKRRNRRRRRRSRSLSGEGIPSPPELEGKILREPLMRVRERF